MKQLRQKIEPNITEIKGVNGNTYEAKIVIAGQDNHKVFKTLEEAREYLKNVKKYAKRKEIDYPYNLIDELGLDDEKLDIDYIEKHFDENLNYVLTTLSEREEAIILGYYKEGYLLDALALQHNVTRERIRQIASKGIRKLKHPARKVILMYGIEYKKLQDDVNKLKEQLRQEINHLEKISAKTKDDIVTLTIQLDRSIDSMGLSIRSYNCLRRGGITTLGQILDKSVEELLRIRNMGRKSVKEIKDKVNELGFTLKKFEYQKELKENEFDEYDLIFMEEEI